VTVSAPLCFSRTAHGQLQPAGAVRRMQLVLESAEAGADGVQQKLSNNQKHKQGLQSHRCKRISLPACQT